MHFVERLATGMQRKKRENSCARYGQPKVNEQFKGTGLCLKVLFKGKQVNRFKGTGLCLKVLFKGKQVNRFKGTGLCLKVPFKGKQFKGTGLIHLIFDLIKMLKLSSSRK